MFASSTSLRLGFVSVVLGSMFTVPALSSASVPTTQPTTIQSNSQLNSEVVKLWIQRNKQAREIQSIQKQLEKTVSDVSDLAFRIEEFQQLITALRANNANDQKVVEEALSSLSAALVKLESQSGEFKKSSSLEIGALQKGVETLSSSVSRLDSSVSNNSTEIQRLMTLVATAEQAVKENTGLLSSVADLETQQKELQKALDYLGQSITKIESAVTKNSAEIQKSIDAANTVEKFAKGSAELQATVSALKAGQQENAQSIQQLNSQSEADSAYTLLIIVALAMAMAIAAIAIIIGRRLASVAEDKDVLREQVEDLKIKQTEALLKDTEQLAAIAEAAAQTQKAVENLHAQASAVSVLATPSIKAVEPDHSLIKVIADRLAFMQVTLYRMDSSVRGHRQLTRSLKQINDNLLAYGYEIVDLLGQSYSEGMKVTANFVEDESLKPGEQIITGISKPQINYNGRMIQSAQVTVSQNLS